MYIRKTNYLQNILFDKYKFVKFIFIFTVH